LIFYRLAPDLLRTGHIYIAETPLFELKLTDGSVLYADTNAEKERLMQEYKGRVKSTKRFKGLGEVDADVLRRTTIHPDTRRLTPLTLDVNDNASRQVIDTLFGADKDNQRKKILTTLLGEHVVSMMEDNALMFDELEETDIEDGIEYTVVE
jgi:DNA gyrase subunit B